MDYLRGGDATRPTIVDQARSTFTLRYRESSELGTPYSPTHSSRFSDSSGFRVASVRGDARDVTMLVPVRARGETSISMLPYAPGNEDAFALITVSPPAQRPEDATPRDVTLVLDISGSMSGRKIEQARAAGHQLLGTLRTTDRFRLIDFSSDVHTFRDDFVNATPQNVRDATRYLDALEANGSTNIEGALREALRPEPTRGRLPLILFVTDGEPTIGDRNPDHLAALASDANAHASVTRRIFTFGLGSDVNVSLLDQLALDGRGTSQFVRPDESVERMVECRRRAVGRSRADGRTCARGRRCASLENAACASVGRLCRSRSRALRPVFGSRLVADHHRRESQRRTRALDHDGRLSRSRTRESVRGALVGHAARWIPERRKAEERRREGNRRRDQVTRRAVQHSDGVHVVSRARTGRRG